MFNEENSSGFQLIRECKSMIDLNVSIRGRGQESARNTTRIGCCTNWLLLTKSEETQTDGATCCIFTHRSLEKLICSMVISPLVKCKISQRLMHCSRWLGSWQQLRLIDKHFIDNGTSEFNVKFSTRTNNNYVNICGLKNQQNLFALSQECICINFHRPLPPTVQTSLNHNTITTGSMHAR